MFEKINGRYLARNGCTVAVHDSVGHQYVDGKALVDIRFVYDNLGYYLPDSNFDLMERVETGATGTRSKIVGCEKCERENT